MTTDQLGVIGVLMGGYSSEREISLRSGKAVYEALLAEGCNVKAIDIQDEEEIKIKDTIKKAGVDVAFITLHGQLGEDGRIQAILEDLEIPYTGSGVAASRIAINKIQTQKVLKKNHVPVPEHFITFEEDHVKPQTIEHHFGGWPLVVKPACEGSSIGISLVKNTEELSEALQAAFRYGPQVIVERFVRGRELTVGILDNQALPIVEVCSKRNFFDFTAKYQQGLTEYVVPAQISDDVTHLLQETALKAFNVVGCKDLARIDFILSDEGKMYVLEINTIPGFTATSLLPKAAKVKGLSFNQLCLKLVELAYGQKTAKI